MTTDIYIAKCACGWSVKKTDDNSFFTIGPQKSAKQAAKGHTGKTKCSFENIEIRKNE